jgi:hypothetical protein
MCFQKLQRLYALLAPGSHIVVSIHLPSGVPKLLHCAQLTCDVYATQYRYCGVLRWAVRARDLRLGEMAGNLTEWLVRPIGRGG